ncbi:LIMR family protein [Acrasis kona]|uniref:LIMR family protein n=1 Tax=Acrasis kona TaxID=1008807 RepID=A0AAW2YLE5_9EUKA
MNAISYVLIVFGVLFPIVSIAASIIFIWFYSSPDDYKRAWIPRIIIVISFSMSFLSVFLLPLDVANARLSGDLGYALGIIWQVFYGLVCVLVIVVIPFAIFYYEAEDPDQSSILHQFKWALLFSSIILIVSTIAIGVSYYWVAISSVPYQVQYNQVYSNSLDGAVEQNDDAMYSNRRLEIQVSFIVYALAVINVLGYFILVVNGGWGLTALPVQLFKDFLNRPKRIHHEEFSRQKEVVINKSEKLIEIGRALQDAQENGKLKRGEIKLLKDFKEASVTLEKDWDVLHTSFYQGGGSIVLPYIWLILSFVCSCISIVWIIHIILYMTVPGHPTNVTAGPINPCLNSVFLFLDKATSEFPFFGALVYLLFTFYLLVCVMVGTTYISRLIPFLAVHPMKRRDTLMNSLLFNVGTMLLGSTAVNQFSTVAFSGYARGTSVDALFVTGISSIKYLSYYFLVTPYAILLFAAIGFVMTFICWRERTKNEKDLEATLARLNLN